MQQYIYHGTVNSREGAVCIVTHRFVNVSDCVKMSEHHLMNDEKYKVIFEDGYDVNVYGRNLTRNWVEMDDSLLRRFKRFINDISFGDEDEEPKEHEYVEVKFPDTPHKTYHYLNCGLKLKRGMNVVVEAKGNYGVARIIDFHRQCGRATKYVVQIVDTESVDARKEKLQKIKELKRAIDLRVALLREEMEIKLLADADGELGALLKELHALQAEGE